MSSDRRLYDRPSTSQEVMLSVGMQFRMCKLLDLSMGGAFLDIGWSVLTRDRPVEVALTITSAGSSQVYRLPAQVARITVSGAAIRFSSLDESAHHALSSHITNLAQNHNNGVTERVSA